MRMKWIGIIVIVGIMTMLCACAEDKTGADISPDVVAQAALENVAFRDSLVKAEGDAASNFYRLDDTVIEHAIYISGSGATAEEIAVLKVAKGKAADAKVILERRVEEQKRRFIDYVPGEMVKLNAPVIVTKGDLAVLILADDASGAEAAVSEIMGGLTELKR